MAAASPAAICEEYSSVSEYASFIVLENDAEYRRWHEAEARGAGIDDGEWTAAEDRMTADHLSPLPDQLEWLHDAGFEDVDCLFKDRGYAVMFGRKPAGYSGGPSAPGAKTGQPDG